MTWQGATAGRRWWQAWAGTRTSATGRGGSLPGTTGGRCAAGRTCAGEDGRAGGGRGLVKMKKRGGGDDGSGDDG